MNRTKILVSIVLSAMFIALLSGLFSANISPYVSATELKSDEIPHTNVQVFGQVLLDTIYFDNDSGITTFDLTDGNQSISVTHRGLINNLEHSTDVVVIGDYVDDVFQAEKVLVKCPSKYEDAPREG